MRSTRCSLAAIVSSVYLLNSIRFLANDLRLPLVCAGTHEAKQALMTDQQLADRFEATEFPAWPPALSKRLDSALLRQTRDRSHTRPSAAPFPSGIKVHQQLRIPAFGCSKLAD
jgi:hypothetical protein